VDRTWTRALVWVAIAGLVAIDVLYLAIIHSQGGGGPGPADVLTVPFIASYIALMAILLLGSLVSPVSAKPVLRAAASAGLLVLAVLAAFSIGVLILVFAALAIVASIQALVVRHTPRVLGAAVFAAILSVALLVTGLQISWQYLVCPSHGQIGGTTAGFFGQLSYECDNGRLTFR
jgi:hypothetical protein